MRVYTEAQLERKRLYLKLWKKNNKDRVRASNKKYSEKNKDRINAYNKIWYKKNKDKKKAYNKIWCEKNKDKRKATRKAWEERNPNRRRAWHDNNKDKVKAINKAYRENNKNKINAWASEGRCRRLFATCKTSIKARREMIYLIASEISLETGIAHDVDHIIPISKGGINHEEFLMVTTYKYNRQKRAKLDHPLPEIQYLILDDLVQLYLKEVI